MRRALIALILVATACTPTLAEDDTGWDCSRMGNQSCAPVSYEDRTGHAHEGWKGEPTVNCAHSFRENGRLFCKGTGKWVGWFAQEATR